jgi:hypothetical protein
MSAIGSNPENICSTRVLRILTQLGSRLCSAAAESTAVHGLKNNEGQVAAKGADPLVVQMGVYKTGTGTFLLEWKDPRWVKYDDYTVAIPEGDLWLAAPTSATVVQSSNHCMNYDFRHRVDVRKMDRNSRRISGTLKGPFGRGIAAVKRY